MTLDRLCCERLFLQFSLLLWFAETAISSPKSSLPRKPSGTDQHLRLHSHFRPCTAFSKWIWRAHRLLHTPTHKGRGCWSWKLKFHYKVATVCIRQRLQLLPIMWWPLQVITCCGLSKLVFLGMRNGCNWDRSCASHRSLDLTLLDHVHLGERWSTDSSYGASLSSLKNLWSWRLELPKPRLVVFLRFMWKGPSLRVSCGAGACWKFWGKKM